MILEKFLGQTAWRGNFLLVCMFLPVYIGGCIPPDFTYRAIVAAIGVCLSYLFGALWAFVQLRNPDTRI